MDIDTQKKDILMGVLGVIVLIGSVTYIGIGVKKTLEEKKRPNLSDSNEVEAPLEEKATSSKEKESFASDTPKTKGSSTSEVKQKEPLPEPSGEDLKEGSAVMKVPSEPAEEPTQDDIDSVVLKDSNCRPSEVGKRGRSGIVLEVVAKDQAYRFRVEGTNIEEDFKKGQEKTISFPAYFLEEDQISFECQPLN